MSGLTTNSSINPIEDIRKALERGVEIILVKVDAKNYVKVSLEIIKYFTSIAEGIYVTLNKPYFSLKKMFLKEGININYVYGSVSSPDEKCLFVFCPEDIDLAAKIFK